MTTCDDCGKYTHFPVSRPDVSPDWRVCPHCDGLRGRVPDITKVARKDETKEAR